MVVGGLGSNSCGNGGARTRIVSQFRENQYFFEHGKGPGGPRAAIHSSTVITICKQDLKETAVTKQP
jgi:hypothetical protein